MDANEFAAYAARITGAVLLAEDDEPGPVGPRDNDTCPDPLNPADPLHMWVTRSYEPREHCNCGTLRHPDPERPSRHQH
jgi:hypothetical protein